MSGILTRDEETIRGDILRIKIGGGGGGGVNDYLGDNKERNRYGEMVI